MRTLQRDDSGASVQGLCEPRFERVREALSEILAAICALHLVEAGLLALDVPMMPPWLEKAEQMFVR